MAKYTTSTSKKTVVLYDGKIYDDYWALFWELVEEGDKAPEGYKDCSCIQEWFIKYYLKLDTEEKSVIGA